MLPMTVSAHGEDAGVVPFRVVKPELGTEAIWVTGLQCNLVVRYWTIDEWERLPSRDRPENAQRLGPGYASPSSVPRTV